MILMMLKEIDEAMKTLMTPKKAGTMIPNGTIGIAFEQLPPAFQSLVFQRTEDRNGLPVVVGILADSVAVQIIGEISDLHSVWITLANDERAIIAEYNTLVMLGLFMNIFRDKAYLATETVSRLLKERYSATVHIEGDDKRAIEVIIDEELGIITLGVVPKGKNDE
jgi:hypothetical protein